MQQGVEALRHRPPPGPRLRLSSEQLQQLPALLERGAEAHGFHGEVWTHARIALVIARTCGVTYHPNHIGRVLKRIGWSRQKPVKRATQRDEVAIARWRNGGWAESEKKL